MSMQSFILDALVVMVILSCIPMVSIAIASTVVSWAQAITQIQDPSMNHLIRIVTMSGVVVWAGEWGGSEIMRLFLKALRGVEAVGRFP